MTNTPEIINLTGQYSPELFKEPAGLSTKDEKALWTPERISLAKTLLAGFVSELAPYGVPESAVQLDPSEFIRVLNPAPLSKLLTTPAAGEFIHSGRILVNPKYGKDKAVFTAVLAHELGHFFSARLWERRNTSGLVLRRLGLEMLSTFKKGSALGREKKYTHNVFPWINEAVVHKTSMRIFEKYFPDLAFRPNVPEYEVVVDDKIPLLNLYHYNFFSPRFPLEKLLGSMCEAISQKLPNQYPSPEAAYISFEKAVFGRGWALAWGKAIEKTYGKSALKRLAQLSIEFNGRYITRRNLKQLGDFLLAPLGLKLLVTKSEISPVKT